MEWQKSSSTIVVVCNRLIFCWELPVHFFSVCLFVLEIDSILFKIISCWFYFAFICIFILFWELCLFIWLFNFFFFLVLSLILFLMFFDCLFLFVNIYFLPWISFLMPFFLALFFIFYMWFIGCLCPFWPFISSFNLLILLVFFVNCMIWHFAMLLSDHKWPTFTLNACDASKQNCSQQSCFTIWRVGCHFIFAVPIYLHHRFTV